MYPSAKPYYGTLWIDYSKLPAVILVNTKHELFRNQVLFFLIGAQTATSSLPSKKRHQQKTSTEKNKKYDRKHAH